MKLISRVIDKPNNRTFNWQLTVSPESFKIARGLAPDKFEQVDICIDMDGQQVCLTEDEFCDMIRKMMREKSSN
jgi:hypothetical protein